MKTMFGLRGSALWSHEAEARRTRRNFSMVCKGAGQTKLALRSFVNLSERASAKLRPVAAANVEREILACSGKAGRERKLGSGDACGAQKCILQ